MLFFLRGNRPFVRWGFVAAFTLLFLFSTGWLPKHLIHYLEGQYPVVTNVDSRIRWVVVFGGGSTDMPNAPANVTLTTVSIDRLVEGVRLYRLLPHAKLLLSGGGEGTQTTEAAQLAEVVALFDIPKKDIVLEDTSVNTAAEAKAIQPMLQDEPFYLVTSAIHMPRSMALCRAQGLHPIAAPTNFNSFWSRGWERMYIPNPYNLANLGIAMHEVLGRAVLLISRQTPDTSHSPQ